MTYNKSNPLERIFKTLVCGESIKPNAAFKETLRKAGDTGLIVIERPKMLISRVVLLKKA
jgi:hypothetical protein